MSSNWTALRPWKNSQHYAFEELCCQLAEYENVPQGSKFIRKGTPDGGVECFWVLPSGDEWAWQAKFLFLPFNAGKWRQLDESVQNAVRSHPSLVRYTMCLPFDRPDARDRNERRSFLDQWNERVEKWSKHASGLGRSVEFRYWGDHELSERLSKEEHAGRYKFWFDGEFLSQNWFSKHIKEVIANAGDRYTPEVNVKLPIAHVFEGLARTPGFFAKIALLHENIKKAFDNVFFRNLIETAPSEAEELKLVFPPLFNKLSALRSSGWEPILLEGLIDLSMQAAQKCINSLRKHREADKLAEQPNKNRTSGSERDFDTRIYELHRLLDSLYEFRHLGLSASAQSANKPALLIVGDAGSGKTHLLCDIATQQIQNGWPTIVLLGQQFGNGEPWKQILDLLKLSCTRDELLGALDAAALASGVRALLLIDALNEGEGEKVWPKHLAGMLAHLEAYPRIGIALTVRNSYETVIVPATLLSQEKVIREEHRGFQEHEYEAANRFFTYFGIEPSVPLLYPEFKNPQFLLLFCKGLRNKGLSRVPLGLHGISSIFNFYLDSINDKLAKPDHLNFDISDRLVQKAHGYHLRTHGQETCSMAGSR